MLRRLSTSQHILHRVTSHKTRVLLPGTRVAEFSSKKSWHPNSVKEADEVAKDSLALKLQDAYRVAAEKTVPWFLKNMPASYFRSVPSNERLDHLSAITSLRNAQDPKLMIKSNDGMVYSFIRSGPTYPGLLSDIMRELPDEVDNSPLARVKIFTALDDSLALDVFRYGRHDPFTDLDPEQRSAKENILAYCAEIQAGVYEGDEDHPKPSPHFEPQAVTDFLNNCNSKYVMYSHPRRIARQMALYHAVKGTEGVAVEIEHGWEFRSKENKHHGGPPQIMITVASANVLPKASLQKAAKYLSLGKLNVKRAHLDTIADPGNGHVTMNRILVTVADPKAEPDWHQIETDLKYLKWIDDRPLVIALRHPEISLSKAEIIVAYGNMLHGLLAKEDAFAYSRSRIFEVLERPMYLPITVKIAELFLARFDPRRHLSQAEFEEECAILRKEIRRNVESEDSIKLFNTMVKAVEATLRTNKFVPGRYALALRIDPNLMGYGTVGTDIPFGTFFIHGRRFNGFHVRFRDIARGGLRVVAPPTAEQHSLESARQYNEAYSLAFAQQLKNKDIPEGGSKAVVLVVPNENPLYSNDRNFVIRKSVKAFTDALLDLNTTDPEVKAQIVDYYNKDELIYLGPDENIIPSDITWITQRAALRGYPIPRAFMSSKPDAGINHKVYGVTSEGVNVFAEVALKARGIDPYKQPFTVKITGGTDGDVAGNMIKIMHRDYGDNVKIVGICDGTAVVENPSGLCRDELDRLVAESLPLSSFDPSKVGPSGSFHLADNPEGVRKRNSMHNRVKSDLFVPAGGRPATINENNWKDYLDEEGKPSCSLIVEGANLFITPVARQKLFDEAGVLIVKDSSANKCGVICSSYEIMASMLLETKEFLDIKDELVDDVLVKLRHLARVEAELLFREYQKDPGSALPPHSERISRAITRVHDDLLAKIEGMSEETQNELLTLVEEHLPAKLKEVALDRVTTLVPPAYTKNILAASLASKIIYREGLQYAESLPQSNLAQTAAMYLHQEKRIHSLVDEVKNSGLVDAAEIADLLLRGGVRAGVDKV